MVCLFLTTRSRADVFGGIAAPPPGLLFLPSGLIDVISHQPVSPGASVGACESVCVLDVCFSPVLQQKLLKKLLFKLSPLPRRRPAIPPVGTAGEKRIKKKIHMA